MRFIFLFVFAFIFGICAQADNSLKGKKIAIVYGGWEGHQPEVFAKKVYHWLVEQGAEVRLTNDFNIYTEKGLKDYSLIIQYVTASKLTEEQTKGLIQAVQSGVGLAGCHGGLVDAFRDNTEYQYLVGGQFVKHPGGQVNYKVQIEKIKDPIVLGVEDFELVSEQYYMHVDPNIEVLATTVFDGSTDPWIEGVRMPVCWKKKYGKGKVFFLAIGHAPKELDIPQVWELFSRGLAWAVK